MKNILAPLTAAACLAIAAPALAQSSAWQIRGGITNITPVVGSGDLSAPSLAGTKVDAKGNTQLSGGITWFINDHLSIDLPLALPFKHKVVGDGAIAGVGKLADAHALPATIIAQYRFMGPGSKFQGYVGAGPTYARFYDVKSTAALTGITGGNAATPTTMKLESRFGVSFEVGGSIALDAHWSIEASIHKTMLKTRGSLSTGQVIDVRLDPLSTSLALGYRF